MLNDQLLQNLADQLGFSSLHPGEVQVNREGQEAPISAHIEYCWLLKVLVTMRGAYWLFSIKTYGPDESGSQATDALIQGVFADGDEEEVYNLFWERRTKDLQDPIRDFKNYDLFDTGSGLVLDGNIYDLYIFAHRAAFTFHMHEPKSKKWGQWIKAVYQFRRRLMADDLLNSIMGPPK